MLAWARWLCSGRSPVISSALAALVVVQVVAASNALVLVQGVETRPLAGGLEVKVRTTSKPSYTTYVLDAPARLAVDLDRATVDDEQWKNSSFDNPYFEKVSATPFSSRLGPSVRLEFFLRGESTRQFEATDAGLRLTFYPKAPVAASTDSASDVAAIEDSSGLALQVHSEEPPAESPQVIALVDAMDQESVVEPKPTADEQPSTAVSEEHLDLSSNLMSELGSLVSNLPPMPGSGWKRTTASPAVFETRTDASDMVAVHSDSHADAADLALSRPILDESVSRAPTPIDFRELEEAAVLEKDFRLSDNSGLGLPDLAQAQAPVVSAADNLLFEQQLGAEFTGAPVSFDLKNVDVVELLRIFADLSNMNIIIDPGIRGRVTVKMRDVPWDQAFITILKNQGLGFTVEGNIIRVATLRKLNAEIRAQRQLREAQLVAEPLNTEIVYLNYAAPTQVRRLLQPQLSRRGTILTDARTNSLIIKDVQENINRVKRLVEILDVRTRQISVNAQIVTAAKSFARDLGIIWGGSLIASPAFGNDTGLPFPNDVTTNFGVALPAGGNGFIGFQVGNVLDSVNLSVLLAASEAEGITKTISNPRVTTSDNVSASVRSGSIIPYQSSQVSGNTIVGTVVFREAAISLSVTPHVTSDNFIRMRCTVSADRPDFSIATPAGPPLLTNSLTTTVLVKDGDTFVIGGLNTSTEGENENRVPFLHRLPVVGKLLFRNHRISNNYSDLLMFLSPSIVMDEATKQKSLVFESYDVKEKGQPTTPPNNP